MATTISECACPSAATSIAGDLNNNDLVPHRQNPKDLSLPRTQLDNDLVCGTKIGTKTSSADPNILPGTISV